MEGRITYEKYNPSDFEAYYDLVKSDRVMHYITGKGLTEDAARSTFEHFLKINLRDIHLGYFKVIDLQTGAHIGECKLVNYERDESVLEIGYLLMERLWGRGYGTLICEAMLALAAAAAPGKSVVGIIDPENTASRRLLEKFGFVSFFAGEEDGLATEKLVRHA